MNKLLLCLALSISMCAQILLHYLIYLILYDISISKITERRIKRLARKINREKSRISKLQRLPITRKNFLKIQKLQMDIEIKTCEVSKLSKHLEE